MHIIDSERFGLLLCERLATKTLRVCMIFRSFSFGKWYSSDVRKFILASIALRFEIFHQNLIDLLILLQISISTEFQRLSITHGGAAQVRTFSFFHHHVGKWFEGAPRRFLCLRDAEHR